MRIELPRTRERFGANVFFGPLQVYELDSGLLAEPEYENGAIVGLSYERLHEIQRQMAVVVPVRGERLRLIEGVLFGIPNQCLTIIVSNSPREPVDRFRIEQQAIYAFARHSRKRVLLIHQRDPVVAKAFVEAGYPELLDGDGLVRHGKAEGMLVATILAHLAGKRYVGFVDADNYSPGAAHEYLCEYAAGFALAESQYSMVRILWQSKPKIVDGHMYFARWGRTSRFTNYFLNQLISHYTGFETDIVGTGNAGEHALTLDLALRLDYGAGYAVEPHHIVSLLERFGGERESPDPQVMREGVEIFQIESRNPHFHKAGEHGHVQDMTRAALSSIHGSYLCTEDLRRQIEEELVRHTTMEPGDAVKPVRRYPPLLDVDFDVFRATVEERLQVMPFQPAQPIHEEAPARRRRWWGGTQPARDHPSGETEESPSPR